MMFHGFGMCILGLVGDSRAQNNDAIYVTKRILRKLAGEMQHYESLNCFRRKPCEGKQTLEPWWGISQWGNCCNISPLHNIWHGTEHSATKRSAAQHSTAQHKMYRVRLPCTVYRIPYNVPCYIYIYIIVCLLSIYWLTPHISYITVSINMYHISHHVSSPIVSCSVISVQFSSCHLITSPRHHVKTITHVCMCIYIYI